MRTAIFSALLLLGAAPIALAQGTTQPVTGTPNRDQIVEVGVVLPPDAGTATRPPTLPDRGKIGEIQVDLPVAEVPGMAGQAPKVTITSISPAMADNPGRVEILGTNLHMVREAKVAGTVVPIVFNNGHRMVITPGEQVPGFANLELLRIGGRLDAKMEFTPCLSAQWRGGRARLQLHPDAEGWYLIQYSFRRLDTPVSSPGIYYGGMLDLTAQSGTLYSGLTLDHYAMTYPWMRVPSGASAVGPMYAQALCLVGDEVCYSNMVTIQPHM